MTRYYYPIILAMLILSSCQKAADETQKQIQVNNLNLSLGSVSNIRDSFNIQSNTRWRIERSVNWLQLSDSIGENNSTIFVTTIEDNLSGSPRSGTLSIIPVGATETTPVLITVTQQSMTVDVSWAKVFGGAANDEIFSVVPASDGGHILVGKTSSTNGDITTLFGMEDAWVIKVDASGNKLWSKTYGGSSFDQAWDVVATSDGGCVFAGSTESTDNDITGNHGQTDAWVVKLDATGNIQWSRLFGGSAVDDARSIIQTSDGGFALAGNTTSTDGDATGNNGYNAWMLKLDADGNKLWSRAAVTTAPLGKQIYSLVATTDGGYAMAGMITSNVKDAWVVKVDANGNYLWDKAYGGADWDETNSIIATADGGCILAGGTVSIDGDIVSNHGQTDSWVLRLNAAGTVVSSKTFGGTANEYASAITSTTDGGYLLAGFTNSHDGDVTTNLGSNDGWLLKLNSDFELVWNVPVGGANNDWGKSATSISSSEFICAGSSWSNDGVLSANHGGGDGLLVKVTVQ